MIRHTSASLVTGLTTGLAPASAKQGRVPDDLDRTPLYPTQWAIPEEKKIRYISQNSNKAKPFQCGY